MISMKQRMNILINKMEDGDGYNDNLKRAVFQYVEHYWDKFSTVPASIKYHHTYTGGLLDHSLEVIQLGLNTIGMYGLDERVNKTNFIMAALLHDVGKLERYEYVNGGWGYSNKAILGDPHAVIVGRMDHSLFPVTDFPIVTGMAMPHEVSLAILGHMGGFSISSVKPETLMDVILSTSDHLSSKLVRHGDPRIIQELMGL